MVYQPLFSVSNRKSKQGGENPDSIQDVPDYMWEKKAEIQQTKDSKDKQNKHNLYANMQNVDQHIRKTLSPILPGGFFYFVS